MRKTLIFGLLLLLFFVVSCRENASNFTRVENGDSCTVVDVAGGIEIDCGDGPILVEDGADGKDGVDGVDGADGQDGADGKDGKDGADGSDGSDAEAAVVTKVNVLANQCTQILPNVWVQNINNGSVFDVYYNPNCADNQGEYCDNVIPSYGSNGSVTPGEGSATVCVFDNFLIVGQVINNAGDLRITSIEF